MKIHFCNVGFLNRLEIKKVLKTASKLLGQPSNIEANVAFVDSVEIQQLNNRTRQIDKPTDVLSFPTLADLDKQVIDVDKYQADINVDTSCVMLGDIVICLEVAKQQAEQFGHSQKRELCFLALHGFLHLLGYDHIEQSDQQHMTSLQEKILSQCKIFR